MTPASISGEQQERQEMYMNDDYKRLTRSGNDRMLCGVCTGLGKYLGVDPTVIRILFVLFGFTGSGILAYLVMAVLIPEE